MLALLVGLSHAGSLDALLARGEVSLLETWPDGRLKAATAIALVHAPIDAVWTKLVGWGEYVHWMPQVTKSEVVSLESNVAVVDWTLAVVGPNINFRGRYEQDPVAHRITGTQVSGALSGSNWEWRLEPAGADTMVYRSVRSNVVETNWIIKQVEDENHTLDYGINVATGIVEVRGLIKALGG
jgi:hypothetical protein